MLKKLPLYLVVILSFFYCKEKENISAKFIVEKSIEKHGGLKNWNSLKELSFDKKVILYNEKGIIESDVSQHQKFIFYPKLSGKLSWKNKQDSMFIAYENNVIRKYINDSLVTDSKELMKARNSFFASQYVIRQPFDLLNENVKLDYTGIVKLEDNKNAYEIKVAYKGDSKLSDVWFYYFDVEDFKIIANKVIRQDHTSLVENITFNSSYYFTFNEKRKSYRLDSKGEKTFLRAEYYYSNYKTSYK
ncbi:hypothetical protein OD91_2050 [Lutibacter sp. Hel_I_33_5]|uniref:hypothetical protein n=1 Tax=Lutibacter sp. Hel_I_33_5 TaxID=1566289 RepID=UPI0011A88041|nr:hypothetical protein [Lutibacter sp. Hel_I_33_5]TVZ56752.1 hypothetical protein OD91_2050 [Lutibacter sp. Hel_I_33_5]